MIWLLYDAFNPISSSEYWKGAQNIPVFIREIASDITKQFGTILCNEWSQRDFIGGIKVHEDSIAVFRVINGGRDRHGRPHRWILLVALNSLNEWFATNVLTALECSAFQNQATGIVPPVALLPQEEPKWPLSEKSLTWGCSKDTIISGVSARGEIEAYSIILTSGKQDNGIILIEYVEGNLRGWVKSFTKPTPSISRRIELPQREFLTPKNKKSLRKQEQFLKKYIKRIEKVATKHAFCLLFILFILLLLSISLNILCIRQNRFNWDDLNPLRTNPSVKIYKNEKPYSNSQ